MMISALRPALHAAVLVALATMLNTAVVTAQNTDPNAHFLRTMSDHHQGLILMAGQAAERAMNPRVKAFARRLADEQKAEQTKMLGMLRTSYNESHRPMAMPEHRAMVDSLAQRTGMDYDREFLMLTLTHHHEGIEMGHQMLPSITRADIRAMIAKMDAQQRTEIKEMLRMLGFPPMQQM